MFFKFKFKYYNVIEAAKEISTQTIQTFFKNSNSAQ